MARADKRSSLGGAICLALWIVLLSCGPLPKEKGRDTGFMAKQSGSSAESWVLGPFVKEDRSNPCLVPRPASTFECPVRGELVHWESKDVFNPAAVVKAGKVYLLYRAEDKVGRFKGTSRIGLAESSDGLTFSRRPEPVLFPENDSMKQYEWEGGCEDPRVVADGKGKYIMTYTAYDGKTARLCIASSSDLVNWEKHGLAFEKAYGGKYKDTWSKSGAIVTRLDKGQTIATRINGLYWMYWGDTDIFAATSENLLDWTPVQQENDSLRSVFGPREGRFDSRLVEPGPPALLTERGIVLIYNGMNLAEGGDAHLPAATYAVGQALMDGANPVRLLERTDTWLIRPEKEYEITGQVNNVVFAEGLVNFRGKWLLYYGTADASIAVAGYRPGN